LVENQPPRRGPRGGGGHASALPPNHPLKQFHESCSCCRGHEHRGSNCKATGEQLVKWQHHKIAVLHAYCNRPKDATAHHSDLLEVVDPAPPLDPPSNVEDIEEVHDFETHYMIRSSICYVALISMPSPSLVNLCSCWVVDSACSSNLTAHKHDFLSFSQSHPRPNSLELAVLVLL
jgi:hypothetical protein